MEIRLVSTAGKVLLSVACFTGVACAPKAATPVRMHAEVADLPELGRLVERATRFEPRGYRQPARQERERSLRLLAERSKAMLAETQPWESRVRLTASDANRDKIESSISNVRSGLTTLHDAALRGDTATIRASYARANESYRVLAAHVPQGG